MAEGLNIWRGKQGFGHLKEQVSASYSTKILGNLGERGNASPYHHSESTGPSIVVGLYIKGKYHHVNINNIEDTY